MLQCIARIMHKITDTYSIDTPSRSPRSCSELIDGSASASDCIAAVQKIAEKLLALNRKSQPKIDQKIILMPAFKAFKTRSIWLPAMIDQSIFRFAIQIQ